MSNKVQLFSFQYRVAPKIFNSRPLPLSNPHAIIKFDFEAKPKTKNYQNQNQNQKDESLDYMKPSHTNQKPDF